MNSESTNSINRRYSVKDLLTKYFPGDTITEMRASDVDGAKENREDLLPLAWAYADDMAIQHFLAEYFLAVADDDALVFAGVGDFLSQQIVGSVVFFFFGGEDNVGVHGVVFHGQAVVDVSAAASLLQ